MNHDGRSLVIRTPEGVAFSVELAGPVTRFLALAVDAACVAVLITAAGFAVQFAAATSSDVAMGLMILVFFVLKFGYGMALEWFWRGQTLGKRVLGIRVIDQQALRLHFSQIAIRNLFRVVDSLPVFYLVGGAAMFFSRRAQRLGDYAANTVVVRTPSLTRPDVARVLREEKFNSLRRHPHLAARLRQKATPAEAALALQALLRRETLDPPERVDLYADLASYFQALVPYPPETLQGLTDEHYLRNVVEILFEARH